MKKLTAILLALPLFAACNTVHQNAPDASGINVEVENEVSHEQSMIPGGTETVMEEKTEDLNLEIDEKATVFNVTGENFKFMMDGQQAPELRVKEGETVVINFTSTDGFHDWVLDEFDASTAQVQTGNSSSVTF